MGGPREIAKNPATGQPLQGADSLRTEELQSRDAAAKTLKAAGFVPLSKRNLGSLKLGLFYLANIIPFVGQFGAWCANRQAMGSQKRDTFLEKHSFLRDFGETYLNATVGRKVNNYRYSEKSGSPVKTTYIGEKTLRKLTKFWSETVGSGFHLFGMTSHEGSMTDHQRRLKYTFQENFRKQFERHPSFELTKTINVGRLMELSGQRARDDEEDLEAEYKEILEKKAKKHALAKIGIESAENVPNDVYDSYDEEYSARLQEAKLTYEDIEKGSKDLKAHFANYLVKFSSIAELYLHKWAIQSLRTAGITADGPNERIDALSDGTCRYQMSKYDMLSGYDNFFGADCKYKTSTVKHISKKAREDWPQLYQKHLDDYRKRLQRAEKDYLDCVKKRAEKPLNSEGYRRLGRKQAELGQELQKIKNEKLDPDISRDFGIAILGVFSEPSALGRWASRFGESLIRSQLQ